MAETQEMTPLERAARAICVEHAMYDPDMMVVGRDNGTVPYWTEFVRDARAVLQAIREPSDAMFEAYTAAADDIDGPAAMHLQERAYQAMIDAALSE